MTAPLEPEELADRLRRAPWRRYVTLGDSLIVGLGDPVEGYPNMAWTEATGQAFTQLHPDFEFLNLGKPYLTARQVRETQLQPERMAEILGPRLAVHREISVRIAERYDTVFFDYFNHPSCEDPSIVSDDLLHPTMPGEAILTDMVLQGLASLVPARTSA